MGTTNILDLNNRLTKVEKGNVAQNSYTSLKNKPKINGVTLTGNKTLADIGAAAAADVGSLSALTTTDKSSVVGAINEVKEDAINLAAMISANTLAGIDISAYNSAANQYTAPTDGYVRFELRNTNQYFYLMVNDSLMLGGEGHQVTNSNDYMSIFVRKGMKLYYTGTVQTAVFYSLT